MGLLVPGRAKSHFLWQRDLTSCYFGFQFVHAKLSNLCAETDELFNSILLKLNGKEIGLWFQQQKQLKTRLAKRGKLLRYLHRVNFPLAAARAKQSLPLMSVSSLEHYMKPENVRDAAVTNSLLLYLFAADRH